eukprot:5746480-Amphidinium_carterae.1
MGQVFLQKDAKTKPKLNLLCFAVVPGQHVGQLPKSAFPWGNFRSHRGSTWTPSLTHAMCTLRLPDA